MIYRCAIAADHRGYTLKNQLIEKLSTTFDLVDVGTHTSERTDYPLYAQKAVALLLQREVTYAILLCGSGTGMAIAANRFNTIYAAVAWDAEIARRAKEEDNCNVLVLPADYLTLAAAEDIVHAWHTAQFKEGRYRNRIALLD